jgi:large-conductance mechanosensitive channel
LSETEIKLKRLELQHDDLLSQREVWHNAQWGIPLAIFAAVIYANWIRDITSFLIVALVITYLYTLVSGVRKQKDAELDMIRREIEALSQKEVHRS